MMDRTDKDVNRQYRTDTIMDRPDRLRETAQTG